MPDTALLRVDGDGLVASANDVAEELLGSCVGRKCCDVVAALSKGEVHCDPNCVALLLKSGGSSGVDRTEVHGESTSLTCSSMDGQVIVAIHRTGEQAPKTPLTKRELEVMALIAKGYTNPRISRTLGISMSTVRTHVERILDKLGARSRAEAVARAVSTGQLRKP